MSFSDSSFCFCIFSGKAHPVIEDRLYREFSNRPYYTWPSSWIKVLSQLACLSERITSQPLIGGNRVSPLVNGDQAYPAMLKTIQEARYSLALSTYIFEHNVEVYDRGVAEKVGRILTEKAAIGREVSGLELQGQPFLPKLRNQVFRLFSPYL